MNVLTEIMDKFIENYPNFYRSSKARRGVTDQLTNNVLQSAKGKLKLRKIPY